MICLFLGLFCLPAPSPPFLLLDVFVFILIIRDCKIDKCVLSVAKSSGALKVKLWYLRFLSEITCVVKGVEAGLMA